MTAVEFLVVYLSAGAPFGVLLFFSGHSARIQVRVIRSVAASLIWPMLALSWIHRKLLNRSRADEAVQRPGPRSHEIFRDPIVAEYLTLTRALLESEADGMNKSVELFEIAGHSNPILAARCSARQRNSLLKHRHNASAGAFRSHVCRQYFSNPAFVEALVSECRRLGDDQTADLIERPSKTEKAADSLEPRADSVRFAA